MNKPRKTPTPEQKAWMKESGYTESQLDSFWDDNIDTNTIVKNLNFHGLTWRDMNLSCVKQLPTQKERDLKFIAERAEKERAEKEAEEKKKADAEYYKEHFDEIMLVKIINGEELTKKELSELVFGFGVETDYGENRRWSRTNTTIFCLKDRFFSVCWEEGLTEYQENEFYEQPFEVKRNTYEKTIMVTEWTKLDDNSGGNE